MSEKLVKPGYQFLADGSKLCVQLAVHVPGHALDRNYDPKGFKSGVLCVGSRSWTPSTHTYERQLLFMVGAN